MNEIRLSLGRSSGIRERRNCLTSVSVFSSNGRLQVGQIPLSFAFRIEKSMIAGAYLELLWYLDVVAKDQFPLLVKNDLALFLEDYDRSRGNNFH